MATILCCRRRSAMISGLSTIRLHLHELDGSREEQVDDNSVGVCLTNIMRVMIVDYVIIVM